MIEPISAKDLIVKTSCFLTLSAANVIHKLLTRKLQHAVQAIHKLSCYLLFLFLYFILFSNLFTDS